LCQRKLIGYLHTSEACSLLLLVQTRGIAWAAALNPQSPVVQIVLQDHLLDGACVVQEWQVQGAESGLFLIDLPWGAGAGPMSGAMRWSLGNLGVLHINLRLDGWVVNRGFDKIVVLGQTMMDSLLILGVNLPLHGTMMPWAHAAG
jgi:hypothetical protein